MKTKTAIKPNRIEDLAVHDAKKPVLLTITKRDIEESNIKDPKHCAVAVGAIRYFNADEVRVHMSRAYVRKGKQWTRYILDARTQRELVAFDRGGTFEPGIYRLLAPTKTMALGRRRGGDWDSALKPKKHHATPLRTRNVRLTMAKDIRKGLSS